MMSAALDELRQSGQVKAIGLGVNEWEVVRDAMQEIDLDVTMLAGRYTLLEQKSLSPFLDECVARGVGIVIASSDLLEIESLAHRVIPFANQRPGPELAQDAFSESAFIAAISGTQPCAN